MPVPATASRSQSPEPPRRLAASTDISISIFDVEPGTCPKCFAPIEPERLPDAALCLDCIVER